MRSAMRCQISIFFIVGALPLRVSWTTLSVSFKRALQVEFCASCHVMEPYASRRPRP